jgi:hypothetical protein
MFVDTLWNIILDKTEVQRRVKGCDKEGKGFIMDIKRPLLRILFT